MADKHLISEVHALGNFMAAAGCNFRQTVYIVCGHCRYPATGQGCMDMLYAPNRAGQPTFLPVVDAQNIFAPEGVDQSDCLMTCGYTKFRELFTSWIADQNIPAGECPLLYMSKSAGTDLQD